MPTQRSIWCPGCERRTLHSAPSRTFPILLWFSAGLLFPPLWLAILFLLVAPMRCQFCGRRNSILSFAPRGARRRPEVVPRSEEGATASPLERTVAGVLAKIGGASIALVMIMIAFNLKRDPPASSSAHNPAPNSPSPRSSESSRSQADPRPNAVDSPRSQAAPAPRPAVDPRSLEALLSKALVASGDSCALLDPASVRVEGLRATVTAVAQWREASAASRRAEVLAAASLWKSVIGGIDGEIVVVDDKRKGIAGWSIARGPWCENR